METMKAVQMHSYGGSEVLVVEEVPRPQAGAGQLLVRVHAASINPFDWKVRAGYMREMMNLPMPFILGYDVAGEVVEVGEGASGFKAGDAIFSRLGQEGGGYAQYALVSAQNAVPKPTSLDWVQAAAVPLAAETAWQSLFDTAGLDSGQSVLIHGGSGGVGSFAIQLAKARGAKVFATASTQNQDLLRELGADEAIDYKTTRFEDVAHDVDVVFDTIGGETQTRSYAVLKPGGFLASVVQPPSEDEAKARNIRTALVYAQPNGANLTQIAQLIDAGKVKPVIDTVLPLSDIRKAHEQSQTGHTRGKIVLQVD